MNRAIELIRDFRQTFRTYERNHHDKAERLAQESRLNPDIRDRLALEARASYDKAEVNKALAETAERWLNNPKQVWVVTLHCLDEIPTTGLGTTEEMAQNDAVSRMLGEKPEALIRYRLKYHPNHTYFSAEQRVIRED